MRITIYIKPESLLIFTEILIKLKDNKLNDEYNFNKYNIVFSEIFNKNFIQISLPIELYLTFKLKYQNENK